MSTGRPVLYPSSWWKANGVAIFLNKDFIFSYFVFSFLATGHKCTVCEIWLIMVAFAVQWYDANEKPRMSYLLVAPKELLLQLQKGLMRLSELCHIQIRKLYMNILSFRDCRLSRIPISYTYTSKFLI